MKRGIASAALAGAMWGLVLMVPQWLPGFSPWLLTVTRFALYGLASLLLAWPLRHTLRAKVGRSDMRALALLSISGNLLYFILLAAAIQLVGIAPATLIVGVLPVTITLLGRGDEGAMALSDLKGPLLMVLAGIVCINIDTFALPDAGHALSERLSGVACALGALACWSHFAASNARHLRRHPRFDSHEWSILLGMMTGLGALLLGAAALAAGLPLTRGAANGGDWAAFWLACAGMALGGSWLANALWYAAARRLPPTLSGQLIVFETVFALLYGFVWLQRWPKPLELASLLLLLGGVCWAARCHARPALRDDMPLAPARQAG